MILLCLFCGMGRAFILLAMTAVTKHDTISSTFSCRVTITIYLPLFTIQAALHKFQSHKTPNLEPELLILQAAQIVNNGRRQHIHSYFGILQYLALAGTSILSLMVRCEVNLDKNHFFFHYGHMMDSLRLKSGGCPNKSNCLTVGIQNCS